MTAQPDITPEMRVRDALNGLKGEKPDNTIDSELEDILWGLTTVGGGMDDFGAMDKKWQKEQVTAAAQTITNLIAQEASKTQQELVRVRADLAFAMGVIEGLTGKPDKYLAQEYPQLTADKELNNG